MLTGTTDLLDISGSLPVVLNCGTQRDLRQHLAALLGCHAQAISQGAVTYQLRRLRLHRLIQRVPKSFRYEVTDFGFRVALFFTRLYNRLLRPGTPFGRVPRYP
jgi:hypothetical protein